MRAWNFMGVLWSFHYYESLGDICGDLYRPLLNTIEISNDYGD
jgi:hypothetical protein